MKNHMHEKTIEESIYRYQQALDSPLTTPENRKLAKESIRQLKIQLRQQIAEGKR